MSKVKEYFSDAWNVLHITTCVLSIVDLSIRAQQLVDSRTIFDDDNYSVILSAFLSVLQSDQPQIFVAMMVASVDEHAYHTLHQE